MGSLWLALACFLSPAPQGTMEYVRSELVLWPVIPNSKHCEDADKGNVLVSEDGRLAEVVAISAETRPVVHALLVDDSVSVLRWRRHLARAVRRYIVAAPDRDTLVVRYMSETEPLIIPPGDEGSAVEGQLTRIESSEPAPRTALRDSLLSTIRTLTEHEGRKVLVVVTDGFDTASRLPETGDVILEAAKGIPDLSVHVVLILDERTQFPRDHDTLLELARSTGGISVRARSTATMVRFLGRLRSRLERELIVAYKPPVRLEHETEGALRTVDIDWVGAPRCRMETARPLERRLAPNDVNEKSPRPR